MNTLASRTALALFAVVSATGCALAGDRVIGNCPTGEVCSTQAPNGLFFLGAAFSDRFRSGVEITAAGGTQTVTVLLGSSNDSPVFDQAFDAATSDPKVATIDKVTPPDVVMSGESDGTASLRLLELGTDKLLDRVDVRVESIDKVTLFPRELFLVASDEVTPWALLSGAKVPLIVQLSDADKNRLVDEGLTLKPASGSAEKQAWDLFEITAPATGEASVTVEAGKGTFTSKAPVVAAIDDIASSKFQTQLNTDGTLEASQDQLLCFVSLSNKMLAVGAEWTFTGSPTITLEPEKKPDSGMTGCVMLKGTVGPAKLTVAASGFSKVIDVNFVKKTSRSARRGDQESTTRHLGAASAGERAGGN